jgi:hypothetical protein
MHDELQCIISGKSQVSYGAPIKTILNYLRASKTSSTLVKTDKHFKREETKNLRDFVDSRNLWLHTIDLSNYVSEGAEQKDNRSVIKKLF